MIFKIVSNFTRLTAREIMYNNFEISLVVFIPNITTNHAITYTNTRKIKALVRCQTFYRKRTLAYDNESEPVDVHFVSLKFE